MPKKGEHTPITEEEAEEWVRRMIGSEEDLGQAGYEDEWLEYVASKLQTERGYEPTESQLSRMEDVRERVFGFAGYRTEFHPVTGVVQYRDTVTGRFLSSSDVGLRFSAFKGWID